ncbi:uncharacterized protein BX663DRAFT_560693 [Cokeromyces recurvatus]|uniref:uncharacterized protein n=1 Tax=Cokeromyces recurvatus TaxID=90255 RepID=UPI00221EB32E|nr:uncharacterized protein BX663DRAFT_560693 [Cokeromyces recurvatus]KAI7903134.1 hypothetical protein BX663DRAFT_560693 [Cokeromyces recurvatus]
MSYHYTSYSETTTTTKSAGGRTHTRTTTRTTTSTPELGTNSSVTIRELSENELSGLSLETTQNYEIADDDRLTKYDFYALMNSEDEDSDSESESDVEYHWFPSLLRNSIIQFLDDKEQETYMDDDTYDNKVEIEENDEDSLYDKSEEDDDDDDEEEEEENEDDTHYKSLNRKRQYCYHLKKHLKKSRKSEQVPVEVFRIIL